MAPSINPDTPRRWWKSAVSNHKLDPTKLDLTTHPAHSASKFSALDFIHLKALWKNRGVDELHDKDYGRINHPLRECLQEFILTSADYFTDDDAKNMKLGAFMLAKSNIETTRGINNNGNTVKGEAPKILRSTRLHATQGQDAIADTLTKQLGSMMIQRPNTPPRPPRTPSPQSGTGSSPGMLGTQDLTVLSPESMAFENNESRDEDSVDAALVSLLETTTLCSEIKMMGSRQGLKWHYTRQAFHLGPAQKPACQARTDGLLVMRGGTNEHCLAILEVKPYKRHMQQEKLEWQEACQMAVWISTSLGEKNPSKRREGLLHTGDPNKKRRVLISMGYRFLYITIAERGQPYENYLYGNARPATPPSKTASPSQDRGRTDTRTAGPSSTAKPNTGTPKTTSQNSRKDAKVKKGGAAAADKPKEPAPEPAPEPTPEDLDINRFLTMNCYGPYSVQDPAHMAVFLRNVLALMLEISDPTER